MEFLGPLLSNPLLEVYVSAVVDLSVQIMLYVKFMLPAELIKLNEKYTLNGVKT